MKEIDGSTSSPLRTTPSDVLSSIPILAPGHQDTGHDELSNVI